MSFQQATGYTTSFVTDAINAIVSLNNNILHKQKYNFLSFLQNFNAANACDGAIIIPGSMPAGFCGDVFSVQSVSAAINTLVYSGRKYL